MPTERSMFRSESYTLETAAWVVGGVVALGVAPAAASAAVAAYVGTGSVLAIGTGVHASVQAFNFTLYYASPVVAAGSSRAFVAIVNGSSSAIRAIQARIRAGDAQLEGDFVPVEAAALDLAMDLAVPGFDAVSQDRRDAGIRRTLSI